MEVPRPLNSLGKNHRYPLNMKLRRSQSLLERFGDEKYVYPLQVIEAAILGSAARWLVSSPSTLHRLGSLITGRVTSGLSWQVETNTETRVAAKCGERNASTVVRRPDEAAAWLRSTISVISLHLPHVTQHVPGFPTSGNRTGHLSHMARLTPRLVKSLKQWFSVCGPQDVIVKPCILLHLNNVV